jgi:HPt (histidine-containing phosphotransfer) domain-containing protein
MLQIDTLLPLYADDASRLALLQDALKYVRSDLASLNDAISSEDYQASLQQTHRAKGTASFLGGDQPTLQYFDQLTNAIKLAASTPEHATSTMTRIALKNHASISYALKQIESMMKAIELSLQQSIAHHQTRTPPDPNDA